MKKIFALCFLVSSTTMWAVAPLPRGYHVKHDHVIKNYVVHHEAYDAQAFADYILSRNENVSTADALDIAEKLIEVSNCYEIDARMYLALMRLESNYQKDARSHTGAVGLTQFTSIGAQEVNDQLGQRGNGNANPKNIRYFNQLVRSCVNSDWTQLWDRKTGWRRQKLLFLKDIELSLVYGATLLKVHLARFYKPNRNLREIYFETLKSYNGEPGDRKVWYAKTILRFFEEMIAEN